MRKIALLVAAALVVSAPLVASMPTFTYAAAAKAKKKGGEAKVKEASPAEANSAFWRALNDLVVSLGQPWPADTGKAGKGGKGGKAKVKRG